MDSLPIVKYLHSRMNHLITIILYCNMRSLTFCALHSLDDRNTVQSSTARSAGTIVVILYRYCHFWFRSCLFDHQVCVCGSLFNSKHKEGGQVSVWHQLLWYICQRILESLIGPKCIPIFTRNKTRFMIKLEY